MLISKNLLLLYCLLFAVIRLNLFFCVKISFWCLWVRGLRMKFFQQVGWLSDELKW